MGYALGLDLGGGQVSVGIRRPDDDVRHERDVVPGADAAREVDALLRRLGDPLPAHGEPVPVRTRLAALVTRSVEAAADRTGSAPDAVMVAHPSSWGPYRIGVLRSALRERHGAATDLLPAAVAAVTHLTDTRPQEGVGRLAVLDVREEHLEVSVVDAGTQAAPAALVAAGRLLTDLGSADVDDAVLAHVLRVVQAGATPTAPDRRDGARLRAACAAAGTDLVTGSSATVVCEVAGATHEVRVAASELDTWLRPRAGRAVAAAADAVAAASPEGVDRVLLVGQVAAMPLLAELVGERFDAPLTVLGGGTHAVARGAALVAGTIAPALVEADAPAEIPTEAQRRRRGHAARHLRARGPARAAALVASSVVALGVAALAVSGNALASPTTPPVGPVPSVSSSVLRDEPRAPGVGGPGADEPALAPPATLAPRVTLLGPPDPLTGFTAVRWAGQATGPAAVQQQASAG